MGCTLLEIMADGLHAVFHRFEAFHRWPVYCWMPIQWPSCFFNLCSSCSSRSNKRRRDCLLPPPRGRLCCRAGLTAPSYSHCWPSYPSTHPQSHTCCYSPATADEPVISKPSYSSAWEITAEYSLAPCRSLPRPRRRPPPWCSRCGLVNVVNERHLSEVDCTWRG